MTTIVIAGGHILVDDKLYVSLDFEAYSEGGGIGIRHINQKDLNLIKGRVLPSEITLNGITYATAEAFVYAFNSVTAPALSYLMTGMRTNTNELLRISGHANSGMQQFQQIVDTVAVTAKFFGCMAVNADAVLTSITNTDGTSGLGYLGAGATARRDVYYPGRFSAIRRASGGDIVIFFDEQ